jgi:hypothetical protein
LQCITQNDRVGCFEFFRNTVEESIAVKNLFQRRATCHLPGKVNIHNICMWGSENPHTVVGNLRGSPKVKGFYALGYEKLYAPFFFGRKTTGLFIMTCWSYG